MPRTLSLIPLLALLVAAACETVEGAGRDIQSAGEVLTEEAQETQAAN